MKLAREQISHLSDTELNRAMYEHYWVINSGDKFDDFFNSVGANKLNYLTDYNLTMPLAYDNELCIELYKKRSGSSDTCWVCNINDTVRALNDNPLRAICEVLVMMAMEAKQ